MTSFLGGNTIQRGQLCILAKIVTLQRALSVRETKRGRCSRNHRIDSCTALDKRKCLRMQRSTPLRHGRVTKTDILPSGYVMALASCRLAQYEVENLETVGKLFDPDKH